MNTFIKISIMLLVLLLTSGFLYAQNYCYEETFDSNLGAWQLSTPNWTILDGVLHFYYMPVSENFNCYALSPEINLPANVQNVAISQYFIDFIDDTGETAKIIVCHNGQESVIWNWNTNQHNDWGQQGGSDLSLSLAEFASQTIRLKFQISGLSTYNVNNWFIYNLKIEGSFTNDMTVSSLTGPHTPSINQNQTYTCVVKNNGTATQSSYNVKLLSENNEELASVLGVTLPSGQSHTYELQWYPFEEVNCTVHAVIELATDEQPINNETIPYEVNVQADGVNSVNVGNGSDLNIIFPLDFYFNNSLTETIYTADQINATGDIRGLVYYDRLVEDITNKHIKIWVCETPREDLQTGWIPSTQMTLVYDGNYTFPKGQHIVVIPFQTVFNYTGGNNLAVMTQQVMDPREYAFENRFLFVNDESTPFRSRYLQHDTYEYDPANPVMTDQICGWYPNTTFLIYNYASATIQGTVTNTTNNLPLADATVSIVENGREVSTAANGHFSIPYMTPGTYNLHASKVGYITTPNIPVTVTQNQTVTQNFTMQPESCVNLSGHIVGSDLPTNGLTGVSVVIDGYNSYTTVTDVNGNFTVSMYVNHSYMLYCSKSGYVSQHIPLTIGSQAYTCPTIIMDEVAYAPTHVIADTTGYMNQAVKVHWNVPQIPNRENVIFKETTNERNVNGYNIYRLVTGQESSPALWTQLNQSIVSDTSYMDNSWSTCVSGTYKYAVRSVYTNNNLSAARISEMVPKNMTVTVMISINTNNGTVAQNGIVTLINNDENTAHLYQQEAGSTCTLYGIWKGIYTLKVKVPGFYQVNQTNISIQDNTDLTVTVNEMPLPPENLTYNEETTGMTLSWNAPHNTDIGIHEDFEMDFPPDGWQAVNTNTSGPDMNGILPNWQRIGALLTSSGPIGPYHGNFQAMVGTAYSHQDEWLITPTIVCPPTITFWTVVFNGSDQMDHYSLKISTDNGQTWDVLWDATAISPEGWNIYSSPIQVNTGVYNGRMAKLAWNAQSSVVDGDATFWLVDAIYTDALEIKAPTLTEPVFSSLHALRYYKTDINKFVSATNRLASNRNFTEYSVYRFVPNQAETQWTLLTTQSSTDTTYVDAQWTSLPAGEYRYAVKASYPNGIVSNPITTAVIPKDMDITVDFQISSNSGDPVDSALVLLKNVDNLSAHSYQLLLPRTGLAHFDNVYRGIYSLSIKKKRFVTYSNDNLILNVPTTQIITLIEDLSPIVNPHHYVESPNVRLTWQAPFSGQEKWIGYCDSLTIDAIGNGQLGEYDVAIRFTPEELENHNHMLITKVMIAGYEQDASYTIRIWKGGNATNGYQCGELVYEQPITNMYYQQWTEVTLNQPVVIDATQELWIGYHLLTQHGYPIGTDHGPVVDGKGNLICMNGVWNKFTDIAPELNWNFSIRAYADFDTIETSYDKESKEAVQIENSFTPRNLLNYKVMRGNTTLYTGTDTQFLDTNVPQDATFVQYAIFAEYTTGESLPVNLQVNLVGNNDPNTATSQNKLIGNYPNPFNPETTICYSLKKASKVTLEVYNILGQKVATLMDKEQIAGYHQIIWNGRNQDQKTVSSGIYFCKMKTQEYSCMQKMILIK